MKKKIFALIMSVAIGCSICGCGLANTKTLSTNTYVLTNVPSNNDLNTWRIRGNGKFLPVTLQKIDNGYEIIGIVEYVNTENKTIWVSYGKGQSADAGASFVQETNEKGEPVLYKGDIEKLKQKFGVED